MNRQDEFRRAGVEKESIDPIWVDRWWGQIVLGMISVVLLTLAFAPVNGFFLAWVGIVPWLVMVARAKTRKRVFLMSWVTGYLFFLANMWWLAYVTVPGLFGLMAILALQWSWAGLIVQPILRGERFLPLRVLGLAGVWVATEWFRGSFPWNGLPWLYLGHTQTAALAMCQVADLVGVGGVSFWVTCINGAIALWIIHRLDFRKCAGAIALAVILALSVLGYGWWRIAETPKYLTGGPKVLVIQSNDPQSNTGEKGKGLEERLDFHVAQTRSGLTEASDVDLVVWSETMMEALNPEALLESRMFASLKRWRDSNQALAAIAHEFNVALIVGGTGHYKLDLSGEFAQWRDRRNSAFFYRPGDLTPSGSYDKIHLVPFGEFMPFRESAPWLFRLILSFGPPNMEHYFLTPGSMDRLTVFNWRNVRYVTPICFEDIDAWMCAAMVRGENGKRADVLVNLTNDGWFKANENPQHLQAAIFRSIENRVPTARSVNTGISGFIDSVGRTGHLVAQNTEGRSAMSLQLDSRYTLFTRWGEWFAYVCVGGTVLGILAGVGLGIKNKKWPRVNGQSSPNDQ